MKKIKAFLSKYKLVVIIVVVLAICIGIWRFISNKNKVITKAGLAEHLWGDYMDLADSYDFIYTHIKNLRRKLLNEGCEDYIKTIYGLGYKFELT